MAAFGLAAAVGDGDVRVPPMTKEATTRAKSTAMSKAEARRVRRWFVSLLAMLTFSSPLGALLVGCGSSDGKAAGGKGGVSGGGGSGTGGFGGTGAPSGEIVWEEDGVWHSVPTALADYTTSASTDVIEIVGAELVLVGERSIGILVGATPPLGGTYQCSDPVAPIITYSDGSTTAYQAQSCRITVAIPTSGAGGGAGNATGTFTFLLTAAGGITKDITNGTFDVPITRGN